MGKKAYVVMMGDDPGEPGRKDWPVCVCITKNGAEIRAFEITEENFLSNDLGIGEDRGITEFFTNRSIKMLLETPIIRSLGIKSGAALDDMTAKDPDSFKQIGEAYISLNDTKKKEFFSGLDSSHTPKIAETELYNG